MSLLFKCQGEKGQKKFAVLEIDEASLSRVTKYIQPKLFVLRIFSATKWIAMVKLYDVSLNYGRRRSLLLKQLFCAMVIRQFLIQRNCKSSQILWI